MGVEKLPPEANIHEMGNAALRLIALNAIIELPQVRTGANLAYADLVASIKRDGLNNQPDVAILDEDQFSGVIQLNNETFKRGIALEDFADRQLKDGSYVVTIAGHTRLAVLRHLQDIAQAEDPNAFTAVWCKVHEIDDPKAFYRRQLSENFHHTPGREEQAVTIYHSYVSGLASKQWRNEREFAQWSGIGMKTVNEAIAFSKLPQVIIDNVLDSKLGKTKKNPLTFSMAVEVGKEANVLVAYASQHLGEPPADLESKEGREYTKAVSKEYLRLVTVIINGVWNGQRAKGQTSLEYIRQEVARIKDIIDPTTNNQLTMDDLLGTPETQAEMHRKRLDDKVKASVKKFSNLLDVFIPEAQDLARLANGTPGDTRVADIIEQMRNQQRQLDMWS